MTQTPQMPIAQSGWAEMFPDVEFLSYAAGWFVCSYRGVTVVTHGGNVDGMSAVAAMVPEQRFRHRRVRQRQQLPAPAGPGFPEHR